MMGDRQQELVASIELNFALADESPKAAELREDLEYARLLMRAAPEMLEALTEFLRFVDLKGTTVPRGDYIRYQVKAIGAAHEAIAKVTDRKGQSRMNEPKHTPNHWIPQCNADGSYDIYTPVGNGEIKGWICRKVASRELARLITAAPDMLAELKTQLAWVRDLADKLCHVLEQSPPGGYMQQTCAMAFFAEFDSTILWQRTADLDATLAEAAGQNMPEIARSSPREKADETL
jgi:hypothetical protein